MKPLKYNQLGPRCSYCNTEAIYRQDGFAGLFACNEHKKDLQKAEDKISQMESHLTEADYQTWVDL